MQEIKNKKFYKTIINSGLWTVFIMFVWELVEEGLENLLAYALSSAIAIFATKVLSTLVIITATQGIKVAIKTFLFPIVKKLTYKKGGDKIMWFKNIFKFLWANKFTILEMLIGGVAGYFGAYYLTITYLVVPVWAIYTISGGVASVTAVLAIHLGGETIANYAKRIAVAKLPKEQQEAINKEIDNAVSLVALAKEEAIKLDKAIVEAKAELVAKQNAEIENLAKQKLANLEKKI